MGGCAIAGGGGWRQRIGVAAVSAAQTSEVRASRPNARRDGPPPRPAARGPQNANTAGRPAGPDARTRVGAPERSQVWDVLDTSSQVENSARLSHGRPISESAPRTPAERLRNRADALALARPLARALAGLPETPLRDGYRRTERCSGVLVEHPDGTIETWRCNLRWCRWCAKVRAALAVERYGEALRALEDPQLVTLTAPNVPGAELRGELTRLLMREREARWALAKAYGGRTPVHGLRKIEVTFNAERGDYHPHLHYYLAGSAVPHELVGGWLARLPDASAAAQDVRPATDPLEVLKYLVKLPAPAAGRIEGATASALDAIFRAVRGRRVVQPLGRLYNLPAIEPADDPLRAPDPSALQLVWEWSDTAENWIENWTGERLAPDPPRRAEPPRGTIPTRRAS